MIKKSVLALVLCAYSLLFGEWFLRLFNPQALLPRYIQAGDHGIRENIPNAQYRHWTPEIEVTMQTNRHGMRDYRDYSVKKPEGTCRVAIFGDSFFMGYEASLEDSFAGRLETDLKQSGKPCEVLNFSVSGFGTAESLVALEKKALAFRPDYVVLEWHFTDPSDNLRSGLFDINNDGELVRFRQSYLPGVSIREKLMSYGVYRWAIEYSHLFSMVREKLGGAIKKLLVTIKSVKPKRANGKAGSEPDAVLPVVEGEPLLRPGINEKLINHFCQLAKQNHATCIVVDMPSKTFEGDIHTSFSLINTHYIVADAVVSPVALFKQASHQGNELFRVKGHAHFNELGYRLAASVVSAYILSR